MISTSTCLSRRQFLQSSTSALAAATSLGLSTRCYAQGNDELRLGLIGCGGRGTGAAVQAMVSPNVHLVAMADAFPDRLETALRLFQSRASSNRDLAGRIDVPRERQFVGLDAYQKLLNSDVDLVILASPPGFRARHFSAAVDAGVHCFLEKPIAVDSPGVREILTAGNLAREQGLAAVVGFNRRYDESHRVAVEKLQNGAIGPITSLEAYWRSGGIWEPRVSLDDVNSLFEYQLRNWYYFTWLSGDHIVEQHSHMIDLVNWVMQTHPVSATPLGGGRRKRVGQKYGDIFDEYITRFHYESGIEMHSHARHQQPPADPKADARGHDWNLVQASIHGTEGSAKFGGSIEMETSSGRERVPRSGTNMYEQEHVEMIASIRSGRPINDISWAAESTLTAIMGRMAAHQQREVTWAEAMQSDESFFPQQVAWDATPPAVPDKFGDYPVPARGRRL